MTRPLIVFAAALLFAAPVSAADKDWSGKKVMPKKANEDLTFGDVDANGTQRNFKPFEVVYKVLREQDGWIRLWTEGQEGWGIKTEWVLLEDAPAFYTGMLRANPRDTFALSNRGVAWEELEEYDNAIKDYSEVIRLEPTDVSGYSNRGNVYVFKKEYDRAVKDFSEAIRLDPSDYINYNNRGWAYHESGEYERAVRDLTQSIRLNPKYPKSFYNRGNSYRAQKEYDRAIEDYTEAIRLEPQYMEAYLERGYTRRLNKEYDEALRDLDKVVELAPKNPDGYRNRGDVYLNRKEYKKAAGEYEAAVKADPKDDWALNSQAWLLATCPDNSIRDGKKAVDLATRACERTKWKNANHIDTLAAAFAEAGDFAKAAKYQKQALAEEAFEKDSGDAGRKRLALYEAGKPYRDGSE